MLVTWGPRKGMNDSPVLLREGTGASLDAAHPCTLRPNRYCPQARAAVPTPPTNLGRVLLVPAVHTLGALVLPSAQASLQLLPQGALPNEPSQPSQRCMGSTVFVTWAANTARRVLVLLITTSNCYSHPRNRPVSCSRPPRLRFEVFQSLHAATKGQKGQHRCVCGQGAGPSYPATPLEGCSQRTDPSSNHWSPV